MSGLAFLMRGSHDLLGEQNGWRNETFLKNNFEADRGASGSGLFGILPLRGHYREVSEYAQSRTYHAFWRPENWVSGGMSAVMIAFCITSALNDLNLPKGTQKSFYHFVSP